MIRIVKVGVVCDSLVWLGVVWYGLVKILKLNSRTSINESMTKVGIELLGQLNSTKVRPCTVGLQ